MKKIIADKALIEGFIVFSCLNILLYFFIVFFNAKMPFDASDYRDKAHHYYQDTRVINKPFNLLRDIGVYDAQWYLRIADKGYPYHPSPDDTDMSKHVMNGLSYAFFPLYPLTIAFINLFTQKIELAAFILTNILLVINFFSLYFILNKYSSKKIALRANFLIFMFPFSIFYRSYFTEGLYLFLLLWFSYFLIKRRLIISAFLLGLITVTKGNGVFLYAYFIYLIYQCLINKKIVVWKALAAIGIMLLPLMIWLFYNLLQTRDPLYFFHIRAAWYFANPLWTIYRNIIVSLMFIYLPFHTFHFSKLEVISMFLLGFLLLKSRKFLPAEFWWISVILFLTPLFVTDMTSFTRYQIVSFPLFFYLAEISDRYFYALIILFALSLLATSLFFVNWFWIG